MVKRKITRAEFEARDVFKKGELKRIRTTGYEAYRVSPRTTTKFGKKYKRIYGATVSPDYNRPTAKKNKFGKPTTFGAKVEWYPHGFTTAKVKSGTRLLQPLKSYPVVQKEARMKLMLKARKKKRK